MNLKLLGCIAMGVFVAHMAIFMLIQQYRAWFEPPPARPPPPNFGMQQEVVVDKETGKKIVNREITVSTKLRPDLYEGRLDQPAGEKGSAKTR
jgi:hypothetical protein